MRFGRYCGFQKRYKFFLLKDVLSFYRLDNVNQQLLKEKGSKVRRGSVIVCYAMTDVNLDAANYTKEEQDKVTYKTIKNAFIKVT